MHCSSLWGRHSRASRARTVNSRISLTRGNNKFPRTIEAEIKREREREKKDGRIWRKRSVDRTERRGERSRRNSFLSLSLCLARDEKTNKVKRSLSRYDSRLVKSCVELLFLVGRGSVFSPCRDYLCHYRIIFIASVPSPPLPRLSLPWLLFKVWSEVTDRGDTRRVASVFRERKISAKS